jgi:hypothetical protein
MRYALVTLILFACGGAPAAPPTPKADGSAAPTTGFAPMLFTVEQLRAGNAKGRRIELRIEADGKPATIEDWEFTAVDDTGATIHAITRDDAGTVLADNTATTTWAELHTHGQFPAATTTIEDNVSITVPAGTFKARLYTVTRDGATWRFWFATDLPGPPVQLTSDKDGKVVMRASMLRAR